MKFGICNETFEDWPLKRAAEFSRACGYTGLELAPFTLAADIRTLSAAARREIRATIEDAGLEVIGLHWLLAKTQGIHLTSPDPAVRAQTQAYFLELVQLCHDVGGKVMVLGSPLQRNLASGVSTSEGMSYAAEVLAGIVPALRALGVVLALEPLGPQEGNFLLTAEQAVALRDQIGADEVQLHLDVKAMSSESIPIPDLIRQNVNHLVHFHANDPNRRGPGMGETDFVPILRTLREVGYQGWVSVEVFDYSPGAEVLARESYENLQRCWQACQTP